MDGIEFERLVADRMQSLGWEATFTPTSGDLGADIVCTLGRSKIVVQCKCYDDRNYVGPAAVGEVLRAKGNYDADQGAIVYRGRATRQTRREALNNRLGLFHFDELEPGCALDRTKEGAEIRKRRELAEAQERRAERQREEREYKSELRDFAEQRRKWEEGSKSHRRWQRVAIAGLFPAVFAFVFDARQLGFAALAFAAYAYFWTSPGRPPRKPMKPDRMEQEEFAEAQLDGCIQLTRDSADIARSLRVAGYEVECRYDGWRLIDKRGNVRNLSDEELFEFSNGLARVPCSKCGVKLRAPAQKRLRLTCPRCGSVEAYST